MPFCIQFHKDVFPELKRQYIDTGKLRFAVFDFPLPSHVYAVPAALFARCAGLQGKYWQVHDAFLTEAQVATPDVIERMANENDLDQERLDTCLKQNETTDQISREANIARQLGVFGTPTFLLGRSPASGTAGEIIEGAPPLGVFETKIQELLEQQRLSTR